MKLSTTFCGTKSRTKLKEKLYVPLHLNILKRSEKGCKDFYLAFMNNEQCTPNYVVKWHILIQNPEGPRWQSGNTLASHL